MICHNIGVQDQQTYVIKRVNEDFFDEGWWLGLHVDAMALAVCRGTWLRAGEAACAAECLTE